MTTELQMQLGKKGLTKELLEEIKKRFEKQKITNLKIVVLKNARELREDIKK